MLNGLFMMFGQLMGLAVIALIVALIVQYATRLVAGFTPTYWVAYRAVFVSYVASFAAGFFVTYLLMSQGVPTSPEAQVLIMIMGFFIQAVLYGVLLVSPIDGPIGFLKGVLISLIQLVVALVLTAIFLGIAMFIEYVF